MTENLITAAAMNVRLRKRRLIVAGLAIVLSLAFHVIVAVYFPAAWIYGDLTGDEVVRDRTDPFQVEIQPEEWRRRVDMEYLRIVSSRTEIDGVEPLEPAWSRIDPAIFEPDQSLESLLDDGMAADMTELEPLPVVDVGPGQEILEITERVVTEPETAFRKAITPDVKRIPDAPDIVVPGTEEDFRKLAAASGLRPTPLSDAGDLPGVDSEIWRPAFTGVVETGFPSATTETVDAMTGHTLGDFFGELDGDVTEVRAVDRYLSLQARKYISPRDRDHMYFAISIQRHESDDEDAEPFLDLLPKDVVFVQDLSGSMGEQRVSACREGIRRSMAYLTEEDRFNIVSFSHRLNQYSDRWVPADEASIRRAQPFLDEMVSGGLTDIKTALDHVIDMEHDPGRPSIALLLTDGLPPNVGETNTTQIIENLTERNQGVVSLFGASTGWWDHTDKMFLMDMLTYRNRGEARLLRDAIEEMPGLIDEMARGFSRPVLTDLRYRFTRESASEVYPLMLSHLYLDRPLVLYGRVPRDKERVAFQVVGRSGKVFYDFVFDVPFDKVAEGESHLMTQWAYHRVYSLISEHMRTQSTRSLRELFETANRYGLEIPYLEDFTAPSRLRWW